MPGRATVTEDVSRYSRLPPPSGLVSPPVQAARDFFRPDDRFREAKRSMTSTSRQPEQRSYSPSAFAKGDRPRGSAIEPRHLDDSRSEGQASQDSRDPISRGAFSDGEEPQTRQTGYRSLLERMEPRSSPSAEAKCAPVFGQMSAADTTDNINHGPKTLVTIHQPERVPAEPYEKELGEISPEISKSTVRLLPSNNQELQNMAEENPPSSRSLHHRDGAPHAGEEEAKAALRSNQSEPKLPAADRQKSTSPPVAVIGEEPKPKEEVKRGKLLQVTEEPATTSSRAMLVEVGQPKGGEYAKQTPAEPRDTESTPQDTLVPLTSTDDRLVTSPSPEHPPQVSEVEPEGASVPPPLATPLDFSKRIQPNQTCSPPPDSTTVTETSELVMPEPSSVPITVLSENHKALKLEKVPAETVVKPFDNQETATQKVHSPSKDNKQILPTRLSSASPPAEPPLSDMHHVLPESSDAPTRYESDQSHPLSPKLSSVPALLPTTTPAITEIQASEADLLVPNVATVPTLITSGSDEELRSEPSASIDPEDPMSAAPALTDAACDMVRIPERDVDMVPATTAAIIESQAVKSGSSPHNVEKALDLTTCGSSRELQEELSASNDTDDLMGALQLQPPIQPAINVTSDEAEIPKPEADSAPSLDDANDVSQDDVQAAHAEVMQAKKISAEPAPVAVFSQHSSSIDAKPIDAPPHVPPGALEQDHGLEARTSLQEDDLATVPVSNDIPSRIHLTDGAAPASHALIDQPSDVPKTAASEGLTTLDMDSIPTTTQGPSDPVADSDRTQADEAHCELTKTSETQPAAKSPSTELMSIPAKVRYVDPEKLRRKFERQAIIARYDIVRYARNKKKELELKTQRLQREYAKLDREWESHKSRITAENEEVTRQLDAISNPATVQEPKPGGRKTRRGFVEQDHELMGFRDGDEEALAKALKAIEQMMESDPTQRALKTEAIVPDMELDPEVYRLAYNDDNSFVLDPLQFYDHGKGEKQGEWTDDEERKFRKLYAAYPKQFGEIAKGLPGKTAAQCVKHYYLTKKKRSFKEGAGRNAQRQASGGQAALMVAPVTHEKLELAGVLATGDRAQAKQVADAVRPSGDSKKGGKRKADDAERSGDSGIKADGQKVKRKTSSKKRLLPSQDPTTPGDRSASDVSSAKKRKTQAKKPARLDLADGRSKSALNRSSSSRGPSSGPPTAEPTTLRGPQQGIFLPDASGLPHRFIVNPPERPHSTPVVTWQDQQSPAESDPYTMAIPDRSIRSTQTVPPENAPVQRTGGMAIMSLLNDIPLAVPTNDNPKAASVASDATEDDGLHV
ncbi:hypothetical protein QFC19_002557 [Naganishia cerealis]|uniref:Uncharacterized protein n=1 Tax=Naganishia cerealis TaxID=610337 RepID=A0ACC2WBX4_9TREE|nr:hypothetical protein QFC19_002557 [Naganishia cerealis]